MFHLPIYSNKENNLKKDILSLLNLPLLLKKKIWGGNLMTILLNIRLTWTTNMIKRRLSEPVWNTPSWWGGYLPVNFKLESPRYSCWYQSTGYFSSFHCYQNHKGQHLFFFFAKSSKYRNFTRFLLKKKEGKWSFLLFLTCFVSFRFILYPKIIVT